MRNILLLILLFQTGLLLAQPGTTPEREVGGKMYYAHQVVAGNTLWGLQQMYGVKADEIMRANPELSEGLKIGQTVLIPIPNKANTTPKVEPVISDYKVKAGETLYGLSRKFNTNVDELIRLNPELADGALKKNQMIKVPGKVDEEEEVTEVPVKEIPNPFIVDTVKAENGTTHTVQVTFSDSVVEHKVLAHETMYSISKRFMVPMETIMKDNKLSSTSVSEGQILIIKVKKEHIESMEVKPVPDPFDTHKGDPIVFEKKDRYKVAIILPFYLDHGAGYSSYVSEVSTQFYMGAAIALDTLKKMGLKADIQYYDSKKDSASVINILNSPGFKDVDLVIGPFYANTQALVAEFCQKNHIRMMMPVSSESGALEGNPLVYAAVPSNMTLMTELGEYVAKNHQKDRIILVKPTRAEDLPMYEAFRDSYNAAKVSGSKAALNETNTESMNLLMTKERNNVFIMPTTNRSTATKFMNGISKSDFRARKDGIIVYGTKEWVEFTDINNIYKNNYNFRFATPNFSDYYDASMINLNRVYRARYKTDLPKWAVQGYDIMLFSCSQFFLDGARVNLIMNQFDMEQVSPEDGFENKHIYVVEQDEFELIDTELHRNDK